MGDQEFERRFREGFSDFEADPASDSWEHIQAGLQKSSPRTYPWRRIAAAILLCFVCIPLGQQNYTNVEYGTHDEEVTTVPEATVPHMTKDSSHVSLHELSYIPPSSKGISKAGKVAAQKTPSPVSLLMPVNRLSSQRIAALETEIMLPGVVPLPISEPAPIIEKPSHQAFRKMRLYFEGSPFLAYHHFSPSAQDAILVDSYTAAASFNKERLGYQLSVGLDVDLSSRIQLTTGLFYRLQRQGVTFQTSELEENQFERTENGYNITPSFITSTHQYQISYQSVGGHIMGLYQLWPSHRGKTQQVGLGFQGSHLMNYHEIVADTDDFLSVSQQAYSVNLAYRITYHISPQLSLSFQPTLNYFLMNNKYTTPISTRPYTFGIGVGVRW